MFRSIRRVIILTLGLLLLLIPLAAVAADGFSDVDDSSIFSADIDWMRDSGVTMGCNPPTNDLYCPKDVVTREQMAAFMHRLARNQVVDAATSLDADKLDGKDASSFVEHDSIIMSTGGPAWEGDVRSKSIHYSIAWDGDQVVMPIQGPVQFGATEYQVESLKVCFEAQMGATITEIMVLAERDGLADLIALNEDVHSGSGCVTIDRTQAGNGNYAVRLTIGGGSGAWMYLFGVESTWEPIPS